VRHISSTVDIRDRAEGHGAAVDAHGLARGVVHAVLLSTVVWAAALYLVLAVW
jgi:hypothetical protein